MPVHVRMFLRFATFVAAVLAGTQSWAVCHVDKVTTIPLTIAGSRLIVPVSINETPGQFMVDTGAEDTLLGADYAARSHVGMDSRADRANQKTFHGSSGETLPVNAAHARHIEVGTISFQDWEFSVVPPEAMGSNLIAQDGILGMDFLHYFDIDIDLPARSFTIWRLTGCTDIHPVWQVDYDAIPLKHTVSQGMTLPAFVNDAELDLQFDTGADGVWLTLDSAHKAGVTDAMLAQDRPIRAYEVGGQLPAVIHRFQVLLLGNAEFNKPGIIVHRNKPRFQTPDGWVDWRFLKSPKIWISYVTNTLFVQAAPKPAGK